MPGDGKVCHLAFDMVADSAVLVTRRTSVGYVSWAAMEAGDVPAGTANGQA